MKKYFTVRGGAGDITGSDKMRPQDNLYLAVNADWQKTAKIPADRTETGTNAQIDMRLEKIMMQDFADFADGKKEMPQVQNFDKAISLYKLARDFETRNKQGMTPIQQDLAKINDLNNFSKFNQSAGELTLQDFTLPFAFDVDADMKDTSKNVLHFYGPGTLLPDTTSYEGPDAEKLLGILEKQTIKLLVMAGINETDAKREVKAGLAFDKKLAKVVKSTEEWSNYVAMYNPMSMQDFLAKFKSFYMKQYLESILPELPETVIVTEPRFLNHVEELINDANFDEIKGWMLIKFIGSVTNVLSQDVRDAAFPYQQAITGAGELPSQEKQAYRLADRIFDEVDGIYYGQTYFGEAAKQDVTEMIKQMLKVYEQRISENDWLSEETKKQAIVKLNALVLKIGYPEKQEEIFNKLAVDENKSLYENVKNINIAKNKENFAKIIKPVDRTVWLMPGNMNNACYDPQRNDLTFPAGILQKPFYDAKQSRAANYGGIGATIGHEISHAFDDNGAQFDEKGNMKNWWAKEDFAEFNKRTQAAIDIYDGLEYGPSKLNGKQVVSENISDISGLTCAIQACKLDKGDLKELFENYARSWMQIQRPEAIKTEIAVDVHAPQPTRVNIPVQCQKEFYETYNVKPQDGMWLDKDKRVVIW
ncbi:M13 family metallopeptidase [Lactobacillus sp.]|uniref:M13 family metallopeptidase n=1 Tax=Lactobacillus sp. TaxID=1591 RepID=UPI00199FAAF7|nr:M13 family metallopeptidase [Lactobacillus sp.]MBD5429012.1 M13 family metallopeptidase [Lactobacillus sp.]